MSEENKKEQTDWLECHHHYNENTQKLLRAYQISSIGMFLLSRCEWSERVIRIECIQSAWDAFIRARKEETGTGFYLNPEEYSKVIANQEKK